MLILLAGGTLRLVVGENRTDILGYGGLEGIGLEERMGIHWSESASTRASGLYTTVPLGVSLCLCTFVSALMTLPWNHS